MKSRKSCLWEPKGMFLRGLLVHTRHTNHDATVAILIEEPVLTRPYGKVEMKNMLFPSYPF